MNDNIKKYWPVVLFALILVIATVALAGDMISNTFKTKNVDGKDIVFSYNDTNVSADEVYDRLYDEHGFQMTIQLLELHVYRNAFEPDKDLIDEAKLQANQIISNLKAQYGEDYKKYLKVALNTLGYKGTEKDLEDYQITIKMTEEVQKNFLLENLDEYFPKYEKEKEPRIISHILVKMENPDSPTEEESAKLEEVKQALLAKEKSFAELAAEYSDDSGSAAVNGSLGVVDKDSISDFVTGFKEQVYKVGVGETTEWFKTTYGYHIIRVDSQDVEDFKKEDSFYSRIFTYNSAIRKNATWSNIEKQKITFGDNKELLAQVKAYYGVDDE